MACKKSFAIGECYSYLSGEETLETRKSVSKRLYGMNAYRNNFEKSHNLKSLILFVEMDVSLVGAPDFKPVCTALTLL